eukprot:g40698.t1
MLPDKLAVTVNTGDPIAVTVASVKTEPCATPSLGPVSVLMDIRDGGVKNPVTMESMAKDVSISVSVKMQRLAIMRLENAIVLQVTLAP